MKRPLFNLLIALGAISLLETTPERSAADPPEVVPGACADGCCHKVCRPTVDTRIVPKRVYNDVCEDFCLPGCRLFGHFGHKKCCDDGQNCGGCARCERPRTHKYLLVKVRECEESFNKCVLEQQCCPAQPPCLEPGPLAPPPPPKKMVQMPRPLEPLLSDK